MASLPTRSLGHSGLEVSTLGLGCNNFGRRIDLEATRAVLDAALDEGVTFLDTAEIYGHGMSEQFLGELLEDRRSRVVVATKFGFRGTDEGPPSGSRDYIRNAVEGSLERLRTDVIDLYWYHRPDGVTPIAETLGALDELVGAGTVRAIGASNFSAEQIAEADAAARENGLTRFTAIQNEYSLLARDVERNDVLSTCERLGLAFVPYFPLASGLLTGKYRRDAPAPPASRLAGRAQVASDAQFELLAALEAYADERSASLLEVAIGALLARPVVASVIAGETKPEQVHENASAARWEPSADDLAALRAVLESHPG